MQIPSKIDPEGDRKQDLQMQVGMEFGWLLDRFWVDFGSQVGAKLAPKSVQDGIEIDIRTWSKN